MIVWYVGGAPLTQVTREHRAANLNRDLQEFISATASEFTEMQAKLQDLDAQAANHLKEEQDLKELILDTAKGRRGPAYVCPLSRRQVPCAGLAFLRRPAVLRVAGEVRLDIRARRLRATGFLRRQRQAMRICLPETLPEAAGPESDFSSASAGLTAVRWAEPPGLGMSRAPTGINGGSV